jgi:hypothetical protein
MVVNDERTSRTVQRNKAEEFVRGVRPKFTDWRIAMRKSFSVGFAAVLTLLAVGFLAAQDQSSYTGTVTASQIASTGSVGMWEKKLNCHGEADCAQRLVRAGGKYVLVTSAGVYQLSDQNKAARFVAQRVTVTGSFDSSKKTIEVADVQIYNPSSAMSAGLQ